MNIINNKGFTLIELLGVIVILVTILLVAIPSVNSTLERKKTKDLELKKEAVISAGEIYANNNKRINEFNYDSYLNSSCCISIDDLLNSNLITKEEYDVVNNNGYKYVKKNEIVQERMDDCIKKVK